MDPDQPRIPCPRGTRWRHYVNLHSTAGKLEWLLGRFQFGPLSDAHEVWFVASGEQKADAVHAGLTGSYPDVPCAGPRGRKRTLWHLDAAAAAKL